MAQTTAGAPDRTKLDRNQRREMVRSKLNDTKATLTAVTYNIHSCVNIFGRENPAAVASKIPSDRRANSGRTPFALCMPRC